MNCYTCLSLLLTLGQLWPCLPSMQNHNTHKMNQPFATLQRVKRGWVWSQFFVLEEQILTEPLSVGQLKSDSDKHDGTFKYILTGDGAGSIFTIDEYTGTIHVTQKLDREEKPFYTLRAQAINRNTQLPVEPESEFIIKVQDINDQEPKFLDGPYEATVPEMSPEGTSVIQVTATDGDDPAYGNSARLLYSILQGQPYFSVEPKTGVIRISSQMDRETKEQYFVIIQAKDMVGQMGGFSGTATVTINLSDINDNKPIFQQKFYYMNISEAAPAGSTIGKIMAEDSDIGENAAMNYVIEGEESLVFDIITNNETQEGIAILKERVDFESKRRYSVRVKAINRQMDDHFMKEGPFEDTTIIKISVEDADEPPVFTSQNYVMEIAEGATNGSFVGAITARDPDNANSPIRYSIVHSTYLKRLFSINAHNGTIIITKLLDRETAAWHNVTVTATEMRNPEQVSEVTVYVQVLDVNDHAPEFPKHYEIYVCENARSGQLIHTISAVDKDDSVEGHHFYFTLAREATNNSNFTVRDNQDNTAGILTAKNGFSRQEQFAFFLPVLIVDNGTPSLTSTNTLTVSVCDCDTEASAQSCRFGAFMFSMGLSIEALVAVLACILVILVFFLAMLVLRQRRKQSLFPDKPEEFRENIVRYDDEGGGEEDTEAFDISALRTRTVMREHKSRRNFTTEIQSLYRQSLQVGPDSAVFREFILEKLKEANADPTAPPYDSLQTYAFEGTGSLAGSLSSLGSSMSDVDENYDYPTERGLDFKQLACTYDPN
ncbi:3-ketoacyl-CoA thiolase, mitochondrial [Platysternon megacephalum]|uniref:3-ketoacyl-CoA thiolase, mitochondrial n=1 Tax=Platysternon megacephalum TaxID=55544 RepID=A0A4D9EEK5_9SAUR|nr:3-ketoacyl-CoA thiolase, mitochondrial [Platysternon megacephalum]